MHYNYENYEEINEETYQYYMKKFDEIVEDWERNKICSNEKNMRFGILFKNREFFNKFMQYAEQRKGQKIQ
jgi:hypothetical protein